VSRLAPLSLGELIEHWTLRDDEAGLVAVKHGDTQLAFALLLRYYGRYGRFPRNRGELHPDAVEFMARAVKADPADLAGYDWSGRTIKRHRTEIRQHFGFRECGKEDGAKLAEFLAGDAAQRERRYELIKEQFLGECRLRQLEPPSADQVERYVRSALFQAGKLLARRIMDQLTPETAGRLLALIGADDVPEDEGEEPDLLRMIKSSPGGVSLSTMLAEGVCADRGSRAAAGSPDVHHWWTSSVVAWSVCRHGGPAIPREGMNRSVRDFRSETGSYRHRSAVRR
jgi:Domain of unknown function (DUF4158)